MSPCMHFFYEDKDRIQIYSKLYFSCFVRYFWLRFGLATAINNHLILKIRFVREENHPLNLCSRVMNSQRLFCIKKTGVY